MRRWIAAWFAIGLLAFATATAADVLPGKLRVERLKNGLTVVMAPTGSQGTVSYYSVVRTGSRDETDARHTGFAHLFEHMMFRGTSAYPRAKYDAKIQELGADNNAFTWFDLTCFTVTAATSALPDIIELEADRFQNLAYTEADYKTETGAVLGEYSMAAADPELPLYEKLLATAFEKHTYGHTTLGYFDDVKAMPGYYKYSVAFHKRFYTPDNTTLVVTGAFDPDKTLTLIEQRYGKWKGTRAKTTVTAEPAQTKERRAHVAWSGQTSDRLTIGYKIPAFGTNADSAALEVASHLLFGETSPLYRKLVLEERKVLELSASAGLAEHVSRDPFLFSVGLTLAKGTSFDEVLSAIDAALVEATATPPQEERVEDVRRHVRAAFALDLETPKDAAFALAMLISATGDPHAIDKWVDAVGAVTATDVRRVTRDFLNAARRTVVTLSFDPAKGGAK